MDGAGQTGYIPEVVRLLKKYSLSRYFDTFMCNTIFPSKISWKDTSDVKLRIGNCISGIAEHLSQISLGFDVLFRLSRFTTFGYCQTDPQKL